MTEHTDTPDNRPFLRSVFILLRHWRFLLGVFLATFVLAIVIVLFLPNWYKSTATFLPPKQESGLLEGIGGGLSSTLKTFGIAGSKSSEGYSYISILESRRMAEILIKEFDLVKIYEIDDGSIEKTIKALGESSEFVFDEDGRVIIQVWDKNPQRAANMANAYFLHLNEISTQLNATEARNNRKFIELQYRSTQDSLRTLEESFAEFQRRTKIYSLEEQTKATISAAGELYATLGLQKVRLEILERSLGPDDAEVRALRIAVAELEKQVPGLGDNELAGLLGDKISDLPEEGLKYIRLYRDIEILSKLQGFILPLFQQAVIDEQKQLNVLVPLDVAQPAERKDKPKRSVIVLAAVLSVLVLAVMFLLIRERMRWYALTHPEEWAGVLRSMKRRQ